MIIEQKKCVITKKIKRKMNIFVKLVVNKLVVCGAKYLPRV